MCGELTQLSEGYFGPKNRYGFWVDTAGESGPAANKTVCGGFRLEVDPPGPKRTNATESSEEALYTADCTRPISAADVESLLDFLNDKHFADPDTAPKDDIDAFSSFYLQAGLQDAGPPLKLSDVLCACPVKFDRDLLKTDLNVYVTWGGEPLPLFNPYIYIPAPPAEAVSSKTVMRIVLPSVFGGALMLLAVLVYVQYQRNLANYGWVLKEDELEFDEPVQMLGQGAQGKDFALARPPPQGLTVVADCPAGDVVAARFRGTEVAVKRIFVGPERSFSLSSAFSAIFSPSVRELSSRDASGRGSPPSRRAFDVEAGPSAAAPARVAWQVPGSAEERSAADISFQHLDEDVLDEIRESSRDNSLLGTASRVVWCCGGRGAAALDRRGLGSPAFGGSPPTTHQTAKTTINEVYRSLYSEMRLVTKLR